MSRVGKKEIAIPKDTVIKLENGVLTVKGPHGELSRAFKKEIEIMIADGIVTLAPKKEESNALWGTYASHVMNMIKGVNSPYEKKLAIEGVGFKWDVQGDTVNLNLGFSHPVKVKVPQGITVKTEKGNMTVSGIDKEKVGQFAADIRSLKKPEPYKGKGIRYETEVIRRKQGKKSA